MRRRGSNYTVGMLLADLVLILLALRLAALGRIFLPFGVRLPPHEVHLPVAIYVMAALVWLSISAMLSIYSSQHPYRRLDEVWAIAGAVLLCNLALAGLLYISYRDVPRLLFLYFLLLQMISLTGLRLGVTIVARLRGQSARTRVLIVGAGRVGQDLAQRIQAEGDELELVGYLDDDPEKQGATFEGAAVLGVTAAAAVAAQQLQVAEVILALPLHAHRHLEAVIRALQAMPVRVYVAPDLFDLAFFRATIEDFRGIPLIGLRDPAIDGPNRVIKRLFDLAIAIPVVLVTAPLLLLIALAIRLDSPGPALFRQTRVGENGKLFTIYKFRSMRVSESEDAPVVAEGAQAAPVHKRRDDPRVTRMGRLLRRTSMDELPQLFNVLKGDMSIVGPRPELPWLVAQYEAWQRERFTVPPGITGWWQINGRSDRPMHLHTEDDLYYIRNYSPWLDLRIVWRTIGAVLRGRGAF